MNACKPPSAATVCSPGRSVKMIRVGEDHLRAGFAQPARVDALHRALRADRHERRRLDGAVRRGESRQRVRRGTCVSA